MKDKHIVPTLLIGLGGIGSKIVNSIYGRLDENRRRAFGFLAFDTNVNDISGLQHLTLKEHIVQTSEAYTVGDYVRIKGGESKFPWLDMHPVLARKTMTDGAGQIRMVSRLGYTAALNDNARFSKVRSTVAKIFPAKGSGLESTPRIVIVSSLAGGTGAGVFLQTALYIKSLVNRADVLITGVFLLPDVLVNTGVITNQEISNVRANGYACIKELNGLTAIANGLSGYDIELNVFPDRTRAVDIGGVIFNYCFLFDFENTRSGNLYSFSNYLKQVEDFTYLYLYSPLTKEGFSKADNHIRSLIQKGGSNFYCGSGVSVIQYPYQSLSRYYALKWTTLALRENWMKIDSEFKFELAEYKRKQLLGIQDSPPDLSLFFRSTLHTFANNKNPPPFFSMSYRAAFTLRKGEIDKSKALAFLEQVDSYIDNHITIDTRLKQAHEDCKPDETRLKNRKSTKNEIMNCEEYLRHYESEVYKFIQNKVNGIVNTILWAECDARNRSNADYELNTWILRKDEPMNPVTVRYFLYQLKDILQERIASLYTKCNQRAAALTAYKSAYDDKDTEEMESAEDRISSILRSSGNLFKKLMDKDFKDFTDTYLQKSDNQRKALAIYTKEKLSLEVLMDIQEEVGKMLAKWEKFFRNLEEALTGLDHDAEVIANDLDNRVDPTTILVFADKAARNWVWDHHFQYSMLSSNVDTSLYAQIYLGQYQSMCKARQQQVPVEVPAYTLLNEWVVKWVQQNVVETSEEVNVNVVQALQKESSRRGTDHGTHIKEVVGNMQNLASPLIQTVNLSSSETNVQIAYGMHPDAMESMGAQLAEALFASNLVVHPEFSRFEILTSNTLMGIEIRHLRKFHWSPDDGNHGVYFSEYLNVLKQTQNGQNVTPHLDKRWDYPGLFPEINPEYGALRQTQLYRACILGLAYRYLVSVDHIGDKTWQFSVARNVPVKLLYDGKLAAKWMPSLLDSLGQNYYIVDAILELAQHALNADNQTHAGEITKHKFIKGLRSIHYSPIDKDVNMIDLLLRYCDDIAKSDEQLAHRHQLLTEFVDLVYAYFKKVKGSGRAIQTEAAKFLTNLCESSERYKELRSSDTDRELLSGLKELIAR